MAITLLARWSWGALAGFLLTRAITPFVSLLAAPLRGKTSLQLMVGLFCCQRYFLATRLWSGVLTPECAVRKPACPSSAEYNSIRKPVQSTFKARNLPTFKARNLRFSAPQPPEIALLRYHARHDRTDLQQTPVDSQRLQAGSVVYHRRRPSGTKSGQLSDGAFERRAQV